MSIKFTEQDIVSRKAVAAKSHYIEFLKSWVNLLEDRILHLPEDILCRAGIEEKMELVTQMSIGSKVAYVEKDEIIQCIFNN